MRKKQASVRAPKSREREILIESTRYNELTYFPYEKRRSFICNYQRLTYPLPTSNSKPAKS